MGLSTPTPPLPVSRNIPVGVPTLHPNIYHIFDLYINSSGVTDSGLHSVDVKRVVGGATYTVLSLTEYNNNNNNALTYLYTSTIRYTSYIYSNIAYQLCCYAALHSSVRKLNQRSYSMYNILWKLKSCNGKLIIASKIVFGK